MSCSPGARKETDPLERLIAPGAHLSDPSPAPPLKPQPLAKNILPSHQAESLVGSFSCHLRPQFLVLHPLFWLPCWRVSVSQVLFLKRSLCLAPKLPLPKYSTSISRMNEQLSE